MKNEKGTIVLAGGVIGLIAAVVVLAAMIYLLVRPYKEATKLTVKVRD